MLFGSGMKTREIANDTSVMAQLKRASSRQLIGAQCSGTLMLAKLGYLKTIPACTDLLTKPWVQEAGVCGHGDLGGVPRNCGSNTHSKRAATGGNAAEADVRVGSPLGYSRAS